MSAESAMALATGQSPGLSVVETPAAPPVQTDPPKELESTRFNHLAKKEAEMQKQREEIKRRAEEISKKEAEFNPFYEKYKQFEELKKTDRIAAMKLMEFDDTDLVNFIATQQVEMTPEQKAAKAAQEVINKFETERQKREREAVEANNARIITEFKGKISGVIASDPDKFELSNRMGSVAQELAFDFVAECVKLGMEPPTAEEAANYTEQYYEDFFKSMSTSKKLTPQQAAEAAKDAIQQAKEVPLKPEVSPKPTKTLDSRATATVASTVQRRETASEKRERLIEKLRNGG